MTRPVEGALPAAKLLGAIEVDGGHTLIVEATLDGTLRTLAVPLTGWQAGYLTRRLAPERPGSGASP